MLSYREISTQSPLTSSRTFISLSCTVYMSYFSDSRNNERTNSRNHKLTNFLFLFTGKLASYTQRPWSSSRARVLDWSSQHCTENSSQRSYRQRRTRTQNLVSSRHTYLVSRNLKSYKFTNFLFTNT